MDILYDQPELKPDESETPRVIYTSDPVEERENPHVTGELDEMVVDEDHRLDPGRLTGGERQFLNEMRGAFAERRGDFITYKELMEWCKERPPSAFCSAPVDYKRNGYPPLTNVANRLWKAGLIKKYRRGIWLGTVRGKWAGKITGRNFGVTFWIW
jgi:hypothetical protein